MPSPDHNQVAATFHRTHISSSTSLLTRVRSKYCCFQGAHFLRFSHCRSVHPNMPATNFASLCGGTTDCVAEMASLTKQITHWKIAVAVFSGVLLLVCMCLVLAKLILDRRFTMSKRSPRVDDVEQNGQTRTLVDATGAMPHIISVGNQNRNGRQITITSRKPRRSLSTLFEKIEADEEEDADLGLRAGIPAEWFELKADHHNDNVGVAK